MNVQGIPIGISRENDYDPNLGDSHTDLRRNSG